MNYHRLFTIAAFAAAAILGGFAYSEAFAAPDSDLRERASQALRRGVGFFSEKVAVQGTYLWQYSEDLAKREGEGKASATCGWLQPPGTPSVGMALIAAFEATGDAYYREALRQTAQALVAGQLESGGWYYYVHFDPEGRKRLAYRQGGKKTARNITTLDDDTTQACLRFLMRADRALEFRDAQVREAVKCALNSLLSAQYPNGAWPQGYEKSPDPSQFPVRKASYPDSWSREYPGHQQYWFRYTLNDNVLADVIDTLHEASQIYRDPKAGDDFVKLGKASRAALEKAGDFIRLAQMPEPQPAWAQQYDFELHPSWARKFEPPSVTGGESQGVMKTLLKLYRLTGQAKYLEPIPPAFEYFQRSRLSDGRLARFYELRTSKPLYFTKDYKLTYDDGDMPTHYAFKVSDGTPTVAREYARLKALDPASLARENEPSPVKVTSGLLNEVRQVIEAQDDQGRWVEQGRLRYHGDDDPTTRVIRCDTFRRNVEILSRYLNRGGVSPGY